MVHNVLWFNKYEPNLVTIVIEHELPESQRNCPNCSHPLHDMKVETTRLLKFIPARFEVEEHRHHIYTCRECAKHDELIDQFLPWSKTLSSDCYKTN